MKDELKRILAITRSPFRDKELGAFFERNSLDDLGECLIEFFNYGEDLKEAQEENSSLENRIEELEDEVSEQETEVILIENKLQEFREKYKDLITDLEVLK